MTGPLMLGSYGHPPDDRLPDPEDVKALVKAASDFVEIKAGITDTRRLVAVVNLWKKLGKPFRLIIKTYVCSFLQPGGDLLSTGCRVSVFYVPSSGCSANQSTASLCGSARQEDEASQQARRGARVDSTP